MKLSVIIPIYKVEDTLDRCIESVLRQRIDGEMEVILVDDGSPDRCPQLCDDWKEKASQLCINGLALLVIHKENGGLSSARNAGMAMATGDIITFVDSDDELAPDTFAPLAKTMSEHGEIDVLEYPILVHAGHESEHLLCINDRIWQSAKDYWEQTEGWEHCYVCNKIFRREALKDMLFPQGRVFEDTWFYPELLAKGVTVATASAGKYIYNWNNASITVTADGNVLIALLEALQRAARLMKTPLWSRNGWKLYRSMLFRQIDIYRLTGKILLSFPLCRLICVLHKWFYHSGGLTPSNDLTKKS